jgi:hypothetical protein
MSDSFLTSAYQVSRTISKMHATLSGNGIQTEQFKYGWQDSFVSRTRCSSAVVQQQKGELQTDDIVSDDVSSAAKKTASSRTRSVFKCSCTLYEYSCHPSPGNSCTSHEAAAKQSYGQMMSYQMMCSKRRQLRLSYQMFSFQSMS